MRVALRVSQLACLSSTGASAIGATALHRCDLRWHSHLVLLRFLCGSCFAKSMASPVGGCTTAASSELASKGKRQRGRWQIAAGAQPDPASARTRMHADKTADAARNSAASGHANQTLVLLSLQLAGLNIGIDPRASHLRYNLNARDASLRLAHPCRGKLQISQSTLPAGFSYVQCGQVMTPPPPPPAAPSPPPPAPSGGLSTSGIE